MPCRLKAEQAVAHDHRRAAVPGYFFNVGQGTQGDGFVRIWDLASRTEIQSGSVGRTVGTMVLNHDGTMRATTTSHASDGDLIQLWDVATMTPLGPPLESEERRFVVTMEFGYEWDFNRYAEILAVGLDGDQIELWDVTDHEDPIAT